MQTAKKSGKAFERLVGVDENSDSVPAEGVLLVTQSDGGRAALDELGAAFAGTPYRAYLYLLSFGYGDDYVAIVKSPDPYAYLGMVRTDGINLDVSHEQVMARYRAWDAKHGLRLVGAGRDWLEATFTTPPDDWMAFAKEVYAFSPDVVDQGTGDVETLAKEMREGNFVYLWWD